MSSNGYPFVTKNEVAKRIASEPTFVIECIKILDGKWMASHKVRAGKLVARVAEGDLSPEDLVEAIALVMPYARTLSRILRDRQIAEGSPELLGQALVFGVLRPASDVDTARAEAAPTPPVVETPVVAPKRRGRPPGSKNKKPRSEPEQPSKRPRRS
jgi:hypothetical protein